jgi:hypothetical protein
MYCTKCGEPNADTLKNCRVCGAPLKNRDGVPEDGSTRADISAGTWQQKSRKKRFSLIPAALAAALLIASVLTPAALAWHQPEGYAVEVPDGRFLSPENAVEFFITAVTEMDMDAALSACAINEYAEGYDAQTVIENVRMISPNMAAPNQYGFYRAMNQTAILGSAAMLLRNFIYNFVESEALHTIFDGEWYRLQDDPEREAQEFVESVDPSFICELTIVSIDLPQPELFNSEPNQKNIEQMAGYYGADDITDRIVLYELGGVYYYSGFQLARYGETWKIIRLVSPIANCPAYGSAQQITREEYDELVS